MRIRSIKPEFWRSMDISSLDDWIDRFIFIGLWSYVDDNGVGIDRLSLITTDLFADDVERDPRETFARVSRGLQNLSEAGRIVRYTVSGRSYLYINNWPKHQRIDKPNKARYPDPTCEDAEIRETLARVSRESPEIPAPGTEEQGNRGTGEQGIKDLSEPAASNVSNAYPAAFEEFWSAYPKREQKRDALKAWHAAIKRADNDELVAGAHRYANDPNRISDYTKLPAGWLRADMWLDGPIAPRNAPQPQGSKQDAKVAAYMNGFAQPTADRKELT